MKTAQITTLLVSALAGIALAAFQGTDEEFLETIAAGNVPENVLPEEPEFMDRSLRFARDPQRAGQRCGTNTACAAGLECMRGGFGRFCVPYNCMTNVFESFINKHSLQDWPKEVMAATGFLPEDTMNQTVARQGIRAAASHTRNMIDTNFRESIAKEMGDRAPNMTELLFNMVDTCPHVASAEGVTVMFGLEYEIATVVPKWINSFYLAVGTSDLNFNVENNTNGVEFDFNISAAVYSDICAGVGLDIGLEFSIMGGVLISGKSSDLEECTFLFDVDAGVGSSFGLAVGVGARCVPKFQITQGFGIGAGIGFNGCGTCKVADLDF